MSSKLKVKTLKRRQQRRSGVFIVDSEQISHIALLFPLLTWNKVHADWAKDTKQIHNQS